MKLEMIGCQYEIHTKHSTQPQTGLQ